MSYSYYTSIKLKSQYIFPLFFADKVDRAYKAILPDRAANEFGPLRTLIGVLAEKIISLAPEADIAEVIG